MKKQTVKMIAFNSASQKFEEVFPESEVSVNEMYPRFLVNTDKGERWVSVPDVSAEEMMGTWLEQMSGDDDEEDIPDCFGLTHSFTDIG